MKYVVISARLLLGLMFAVFGSNAFLHFIPMPPMEGLPGDFIGALVKSGYIPS
jgi:putative oxidoreductase